MLTRTVEQEESAVDILIPAAFPFPNLGLLLSLMFVLFGGWFVGSSVAPTDFPMLVGAGLASLFGGTILALPFLFDLLRLPADLFQMFITVDVIASRFGTLLAGMHIIAVALIGAYAMQGAIEWRSLRLLRFAVVSVVLILAALLGIRAFYSFVFVAPFTKDQVLAGLPLLKDPQPHTVHRESPPAEPAGPRDGSLARIEQTGILRACYRRSDYPSAFFNTAGDLVGFDIEMTHQFARQLDAKVELLPVESLADAERRVNSHYCDVFMSLLPIAPESTRRVALTVPVFESAVGLIVEDHRRRSFQTWDGIRALGAIRIATLDERASANFLRQAVPEAEPAFFKDNEDLNDLLSEDPPSFDAVLKLAEEGAAWTIRYPRFNLATPSPALRVPLGYSVARGDDDLLTFFNAWLVNAQGVGTVDALYRYWMLGEIQRARPPRWSVARDVLGWLD